MSDHTDTEIDASLRQSVDLEDDPFDITFEDIYGIEDDVATLREVFVPAIADPDLPVRGPSLVIYGAEGVGKTRLGKAVVSALAARDFQCLQVSAAALTDRDAHRQHRADAEVADVLDALTDQAPAVLYVEEFQEMQFGPDRHLHDAVAAVREAATRVAIVCTLTQSHPRINPASTPEYFEFADFLVNIEQSSQTRKAAILRDDLAALAPQAEHEGLPDIEAAVRDASTAFDVGAIADIARRAVLIAETRSTPATLDVDAVVTAIEQVGAEQAGGQSQSHQRGRDPEQFEPIVPTVRFDDIGGLDAEIQRLREHLQYPQEYEGVYDAAAFSPATGVLLYGPPGTGKTLLAKALATETDRTFLAVEGSAIKSKWFGASEKRLRDLFETAREEAPSIVFFDEFDAIARDRQTSRHSAVRSIVNTLLAELDGIEPNDGVFVVAATNYLDAIDPAIRRQGRLGETIEIPPPNDADQREIFRIYTEDIPVEADVDPNWVVSRLPADATGADIERVVERAFRRAITQASSSETVTIARADLRHAIDELCDGSSDETRSFR